MGNLFASCFVSDHSDFHTLDDDESLKKRKNRLLKEKWRRKWRGIGRRLKRKHITCNDLGFDAMLRLYAHKNDSIFKLYQLSEGSPELLHFYVPQIGNFLLHGSFSLKVQLECFMIDKSSRSLRFAHQCYWFLKAFGKSARSYKCAIVQSSEIDEDDYTSTSTTNNHQQMPRKSTADSSKPTNVISIEGRNGIQELMLAIQNSGTVSAPNFDKNSRLSVIGSSLQQRNDNETIVTATSTDYKGNNNFSNSGISDVEDSKTFNSYIQLPEFKPIECRFSNPQLIGVPRTTATTYTREASSSIASGESTDKLFYDGDISDGVLLNHRSSVGKSDTKTHNDKLNLQMFQWELNFIDTLIQLGDVLFPIEPDLRCKTLQMQLEVLNATFTPSSVLYLPIWKPLHCILRIVPEESFCFSTKERVPFLICVEVLEVQNKSKSSIGSSDQNRRSTSNATAAFMEKLSQSASTTFKHWNSRIKEHLNNNNDNYNRISNRNRVSAEKRKYENVKLRSCSADIATNVGIGSGRNSTVLHSTNYITLEPPSSTIIPPPAGISRSITTGNFRSNNNNNRSIDMIDIGDISNYNDRIANNNNTRIRRSLSVDSYYSSSYSERDVLGQWYTDINNNNNVLKHKYTGEEKFASSLSSNNVAVYPMEKPLIRSAPTSSTVFDPSLSLRPPLSRDRRDSEEQEQYLHNRAEDADDITNGRSRNHTVDNIDPSTGRRSCILFKEKWRDRAQRVRKDSPYGSLKGWKLIPLIVKNNDDLRQEQLASQLLRQFDNIFKECGVDVWMRPYEILATSNDSGIMEAIPDTISIDSLKRNDQSYTDLADFFILHFSSCDGGLKQARKNFISSLAAYSIFTYILQIKDRHNGNILLDALGHIIHIDFGFMLGNSPGGNSNFESAPFKLTNEYIDIMGGPRSRYFLLFRALCVKSFLAVRKHMDRIILLVEMMMVGNESLPCFAGDIAAIIPALRERFKPNLTTSQCRDHVHTLIETSNGHWSTRWYDKYQYFCTGIW